MSPGYLLSKEEGQPGTPEKPLSDLGRVSYHAYWKSVILEFLDDYRKKTFTFEDVAQVTGMHLNDIAITFQLLGFVRYLPSEDSVKLGLCIDWNKVDNHMKKLRSKPRLEIDPECLRWTPLAPISNPFRSPEENSADQDTEADEANKSESEDTATESETVTPKPDAKAEAKAEEIPETPVEVTSSGRRRTRPLKYSETTYQTTPVATDTGRKRRRDNNRKISETVEEKVEDETPRRQRSKSVARRASKAKQMEMEEDSAPVRNRRQSVKETPVYASDSQEESADASALATPATNVVKVKSKRHNTWKGRPRKRQKVAKTPKTTRTASPVAKKAKVDTKVDAYEYKSEDSMDEADKTAPSSVEENPSPKSQTEEAAEKKASEASSEDSSGEADDEMDVEEGEDKKSVASKPATPKVVEENSTDHHTSDMELDSIHMDSPKSIAEKDQVIKETAAEETELEPESAESESKTEAESNTVEETKEAPEGQTPQDARNGEMKSPQKAALDDKETIVISESDDNNSQSCPLPSPKHNAKVPVQQNNENKPKEVQENESPSKVIPVVSTENAHIVLDAKCHEEINVRPPTEQIAPKIQQIETIVVEGESDTANSPQRSISPKKNDKTVISESPKQKTSPVKYNDPIPENNKIEMRKETVIQHQTIDETRNTDKKSPNKSDSIIQSLDSQRDLIYNINKRPDIPKMDPFTEMDRNRLQPQVSKESEPYRNDIMSRKDEVITRNMMDPSMQTYQTTVQSGSMTIHQISTAQHSFLNHRANISKESQAVQTDKVIAKNSETNKINHLPETPVISKSTTKLEVPNPITSPVISPVIPKVPTVTDINYLPRCQSANAAVNLGMERTDLDNSYSNTIPNPLSSPLSVGSDKDKPREKSKLRDVRVNSAHSKLEKSEPVKKAAKVDTPRTTPEPKTFFPEQNTTIRKPETSVPTNVINSITITSKVEPKVTEAPKKQDFYKKEKAAAKCDNKQSSVKHDKSCPTQPKAEQNDTNKMLSKFKYDNELMGKVDYTLNQIPNYHTTQYHNWPAWDPSRLQSTWEPNRILDMKNPDKNYLDKFQGFNLPHLDQMQKSPQKLHAKYDQKDFHNIAYGALSGGIYTTALPHYKESKAPTSKSSDCSQKNDSKPAKQSKTTTACQTQCESKKSQSQNSEAQRHQMMQRQVKQQDVVTSCAEYRQQSPQILTSPGCKTPYQNGPCVQEKTEIEKKSRQQAKKEEIKETSKEEMCEAVSPALQSMGVYTPDSTSNSVHSVQYPACELEISQLGLESPTSISSDLASPCSMMHMHPAPSPQYHHSSIHIPPIMSQPNQPPKQKNISNRNR